MVLQRLSINTSKSQHKYLNTNKLDSLIFYCIYNGRKDVLTIKNYIIFINLLIINNKIHKIFKKNLKCNSTIIIQVIKKNFKRMLI